MMKRVKNWVLVILVVLPHWVLADVKSCISANTQYHIDAVEICAKALKTPGITADEKSTIYGTQASYLIKKNQFNEAENSLELAFNVNPKMLENGVFRYNWLRTKGTLYFTKEEYVSALPFFEQALNVAEIMQKNTLIAFSYNDLGATYLELDNYTEALIWVKKSLAIHEAENNLSKSAAAAANIAEIYLITKEISKALEYFNISIERLNQEVLDDTDRAEALTIAKAKIYLSMAQLYINEKGFEEAINNLLAAIKIYQSFQLKGEEVKVLSTIGKVYLAQNNSDTAMSYLLKAQAIEDDLEGPDNLEFKQVMVDALMQNNQLDMAEQMAHAGLEQAINQSNPLSEVGFLTSLSDINELKGDLKQALLFSKKSESINKGVLANKYDDTRAKLLNELENSRKQREIEELKEQKTISELRIKQQRLMFSLVALLLIGVVAVLLFKLMHRRKMDKMIRRDQSAHSNELMALTVSKNDIKQLFNGMDCHLFCFDLAGLIQYSTVESEIDSKMASIYPEIWQQTTAALNEEDQLNQDLYLDLKTMGLNETVMIHQMHYLDNLLVCLFLSAGTKGEEALRCAENIRKYTDFKHQMNQLNTFTQTLPINHITALNPILLATKTLKLTTNQAKPAVVTGHEFKQALVELMVMCIDIWQSDANQSNIELAEQSGLWLVSIENGQLRTRTMNRYTQIDKIPENPRWLQVVKTAHFVLSHCDLNLNQRQQLNDKIDWLKCHMKNRSLGH